MRAVDHRHDSPHRKPNMNVCLVCYRLSVCDLPIITSEREARSEFLLIYTKNLSMSGRPAGRPAVVTLLGGLYLWNRKPDCQAVFFGG